MFIGLHAKKNTMGTLRAPLQAQKIEKLVKSGYIMVQSLKLSYFKPQMAWNK